MYHLVYGVESSEDGLADETEEDVGLGAFIITFNLQDLLEPDAAHAVRNLLPDDVGGDLSALCVWPDQVRHWYKYKWTGPLHFIDTPDKACSFDYSSKLFNGRLWNGLLDQKGLYGVVGEQGTATAPTAPRTCASPAPSPTSRPSCCTTSTAAPTGDVRMLRNGAGGVCQPNVSVCF